ncbi:hypothetical protein BAE44_0022020 [Dichanthelium oligosanthes]|uniref:Uncharacterized protein n=1 Tax=Dichanthelium oligosanthes TaxID=888268 RepID=A0A1E5UVP2_9POAL|nr:hypothetical protein BAE44_0022020 [Dichanthelium oligosanthes]
MRVTYRYQRLSSEPREGGARAVAARAWAALLMRRAAAGFARVSAARRRWSVRRLWGGRPRPALPLRAARYEYDSASYARNFDDGTWMAEEGLSWHARSFAA